ncbi:MAG: uracil-DNA glycosylase [Desulfobacula sp.]|uniref:uracil-DNA glycosylase n=1 Tax=Desulfobacula sp. TaxID=2593537 RepID=UPI0025B9B4D6|nr:uracil-DNA glycosylase [Desulfobacula sp.]MCD4720520.1 uracil-DNA glycosylase [Desulfobacula sp.]
MNEISYPNFKNDLRNIIEPKCSKCSDLVQKRTEISWGYGPLNSKLIFIAEAPAKGKLEDDPWQGSNYSGIPFTNKKSGKFFRYQMKKMGFDLAKDYYVTNTVKCFPGGSLKDQHKENCNEYLVKEIEIIQPKLIVCVGRTALNEVYQLIMGKKEKLELGPVIKKRIINLHGYNVAAMIHPSRFYFWLKKYGFKNEEEYLNRCRSIFEEYLQ